ncbi:MAG: phosphorylase, partial [Ekhidna sp.]|nr:phosphorylase [Ekhidna sp.]
WRGGRTEAPPRFPGRRGGVFGLDTILQFYKYKHRGKERRLIKALKEALDLHYTPYCFKGATNLLEKFKDCTIVSNTVTCPGFYASQGRKLRIPVRYEGIIDNLQYFHEEDVWVANLEMEAAGYYAFAKLLGHEVISLNAIFTNRVRGTFTKDPNGIIDGLIKKVLERI